LPLLADTITPVQQGNLSLVACVKDLDCKAKVLMHQGQGQGFWP